MSLTLTAPESIVAPGWLIGARTRLVDSWTPLPEMIRLPAISRGAANLAISLRDGATRVGEYRRVQRWSQALHPLHKSPLEVAGPLIDARWDRGWNFAHALIWVAPLALAANHFLRLQGVAEKLSVIVHEDTKPYYISALEWLGFGVVATSSAVVGKVVEVTPTGHAPGYRLIDRLMPNHLAEKLTSDASTPSKIYVSRRDVRRVSNEKEIESFLESKGYQRIYAEDLSVSEQIRHICCATDIVAIHGAALGPLICRAAIANRSPLRLVELFGSGYLVSCYREIAFGLGDQWVGVRGRLTPEVVRDTDQRAQARAHEKSDFVVDPESLSIAMAALQTGQPAYQMLV